ncbi:MAG: DNA-processing protein DprA [Leptolyngbyaceae cyanobacterium]
MIQERIYWLAWSRIEGIGPVLLKRLHLHFGGLEIAWQAGADDLQTVEGIGSVLATAIAQQRQTIDPAAIAPLPEQLTPADDAYPALLFEISDPPPVLYYRGDLALLTTCQTQPAVGIVGTRRPSPYGKRWTQRLSGALSRAGVVVISGLADGIDREAHQSCLAQQGKTIAVLGTGVDQVYPHKNHDLHRDIAAKGLLLSEYPPGTPPDRSHFPRRNRIIAGLSRAIAVTEAPIKSGALITARLANDYGREVYTLPGSLENPQAMGCLHLIEQGAQMIFGEDTLVKALGALPAVPETPETESAPAPPPLSPQLQGVLQEVPTESMALDAIAAQMPHLSIGDLLSALTQLELLGFVAQLPGSRYQRLLL